MLAARCPPCRVSASPTRACPLPRVTRIVRSSTASELNYLCRFKCARALRPARRFKDLRKMKIGVGTLTCLIAAATLFGSAAHAADEPAAQADDTAEGAAIYAARCAACHDHAQDRIPPKVLIATTRAAEDVIDTLTLGVMRVQATGLSADQIRAVAVYFTNKQPA